MYNWYHSTHEAQTRQEWALICCWAFHVSACSYLSWKFRQHKYHIYQQIHLHFQQDGGYFECKALLFFCMDTGTILKVMLYCWKNKLLSETKRKFITLGFEDLTSRTFEVIWMMSSKKAIQQPSGRFEACRLIRRYKINHINTPFCTIIKRKNMRFLLLICHKTDT